MPELEQVAHSCGQEEHDNPKLLKRFTIEVVACSTRLARIWRTTREAIGQTGLADISQKIITTAT